MAADGGVSRDGGDDGRLINPIWYTLHITAVVHVDIRMFPGCSDLGILTYIGPLEMARIQPE